jgi:hypothetical protein
VVGTRQLPSSQLTAISASAIGLQTIVCRWFLWQLFEGLNRLVHELAQILRCSLQLSCCVCKRYHGSNQYTQCTNFLARKRA